jgi:hypothetical protein
MVFHVIWTQTILKFMIPAWVSSLNPSLIYLSTYSTSPLNVTIHLKFNMGLMFF